jgi:integrase/recombinase XerD
MSDDVLSGALVPMIRDVIVPALFVDAGPETRRRVLEFFYSPDSQPEHPDRLRAGGGTVLRVVRPPRNRVGPVRADARGGLQGHPCAAPTVKQHLAAIRMLCDHLVVTGVLRMNPAAAVRGLKHSAKRGKSTIERIAPVVTAPPWPPLPMVISCICPDVTGMSARRDR